MDKMDQYSYRETRFQGHLPDEGALRGFKNSYLYAKNKRFGFYPWGAGDSSLCNCYPGKENLCCYSTVPPLLHGFDP